MKFSLFLFTSVLSLVAFAQGKYTIKGTAHFKEGIAIFSGNERSDTTQVIDGKFTFTGTVNETFLGFVRVGTEQQRAARVILEPGQITVSWLDKDQFRIGGTPNNQRLQQSIDIMQPYHDRIAELNKKYRNSEGDEKDNYYSQFQEALESKAQKQRELILKDPHYSGLTMLLPVYRYEPADALRKYIAQFTAFRNDEHYQRFIKYCEGAFKTETGRVPPSWTLPDDKGGMYSLDGLKGKYVLVDFWASWCGWCRKMTPHLKNLYPAYKARGLEIVSISIDKKEDEEKWRKAMEEDGAPWPQVWDSAKSLPAEYGVTGYPTMFLLDKEGRVLEKIIGYKEEAYFREILDKYVK